VAETSGRFIGNESWRAPAADSYRLLYSMPDTLRGGLAVHICNGMGADAHISLYIIPISDGSGWTEASVGVEPPGYTAVYKNIRVESDGTDGSYWDSTVLWLNPEDRLVGWTSLAGVTFYPHGIEDSI
jgi:hypothetical protein